MLTVPLQPGLSHRGGIAVNIASLRPPPDAFPALGGREGVAKLIDGLYDRIEADPALRPAFNRDLTRERANQKLFFEAWLGGASTYFDRYEWPGLRGRHGRISVNAGMAARWVEHFLASYASVAGDPESAAQVEQPIRRLATALVNRADEPAAGDLLRRRCSGVEMQALTRLVHRDDGAAMAAAAERPEALTANGAALLLIGAVRGKAEAVRELLRQGVDANAVEMLPGAEASAQGLPQLRMTPLCGALAKRRDDVADLLIAHGAQYDIFTAAFLGDCEAVRDLLDSAPSLADAADPASDFANVTPLEHAVVAGHAEVARLLLERGASARACGARPLRTAANAGDAAMTDLLLTHGAEAELIGAGLWTTFPEIAERLVALGADVNRTPGAWIGICCTGNSGHRENAELARALLRCGADVTARYKGRTALHCAAKAGFVETVSALIEHGAEVNALSDSGLTPLDDVEGAGKSIDRQAIRAVLIAHGGHRRP